MSALANNFNQKIAEPTREFNLWKDLFVLVLKKPEDCHQFINNFETCISKLKEHHLKAVEDDCRMRAIVLRAVRAQEFTHCKLEITKDLNITIEEIFRELIDDKLRDFAPSTTDRSF